MKLVRHEKNSLRISLSPEDLERMEVRLEDFDYDLPKGRQIIRELFEKAKNEVGFDVCREKVYIQLYPKNDGGCELFVIKLEEEAECFFFSSFHDFFLAKGMLPQDQTVSCYKIKEQNRFLIFAPNTGAPPAFSEFGQKLKRLPSTAFLRSRCRKI